MFGFKIVTNSFVQLENLMLDQQQVVSNSKPAKQAGSNSKSAGGKVAQLPAHVQKQYPIHY